ncbi:MAG: tail fiber domain-containing protein [Acidobacteria bacterium]|nr:tail fiber domain-containing protein [Acidobacteriota bacterium]
MLLIIVPLTVFAATQSPEPVGRMTANAAGLSFQIGSDNESVTLTISGPNNFQYSHQFAAARSISLRLRDIGATLPDGSYTYEMRLSPRVSDGVRSQLAAAREKGDDAALERIRNDAGLREMPSQSGAFTIMNGSLISSDVNEPPSGPRDKVALSNGTGTAKSQAVHNAPVRALDVVTADDAIIQGSACIGLDCVNNESFGFDTIRLKENNTRIKFDDTSTSAGFANHDWQLTANDSASGGANKFSVEDITAATVPMTITGSAPTNSIFVDSTGRVGFRTSTPVLDLHVATSNTPAMRLEQNNSGGFTAQTWDVAGNEANFFVRDVTGGSRLPFRIRPGAPTSSIDINASGFVGVGTASPSEALTVIGAVKVNGTTSTVTANTTSLDYLSGGGRIVVFGASAGTPATFQMVLKSSDSTTGTTALAFDSSARLGLGGVTSPSSPIQHQNGATLSAGGVWTNASSRALKQDIRDLDTKDALSVLKDIQPVTYSYKIDPTEHHVGFIAEDVPDLVATKDRKGLSAMDVVAVLTSVVKEQQKTIDDLKARLDQIEKKQ